MKPKIFFGNIEILLDTDSNKRFRIISKYLTTQELIKCCEDNIEWYSNPITEESVNWLKELHGDHPSLITIEDQWNYLPNIVEKYPDTEFVIITNCPYIIGSIEADLYRVNNDESITEIGTKAYGLDVTTITRVVMNQYVRAPKIQEKIDYILELVESNDFIKAEEELKFFDNLSQMDDIVRLRFNLSKKTRA